MIFADKDDVVRGLISWTTTYLSWIVDRYKLDTNYDFHEVYIMVTRQIKQTVNKLFTLTKTKFNTTFSYKVCIKLIYMYYAQLFLQDLHIIRGAVFASKINM